MFNTDAPQMPTGPMHMLLDAAVGLFDVSGFSKIADRLEKEEADGGTTVRVDTRAYELLVVRTSCGRGGGSTFYVSTPGEFGTAQCWLLNQESTFRPSTLPLSFLRCCLTVPF